VTTDLNFNNLAAILFDFGGTLVTLEPSNEHLFARAARSVGLELSMPSIRRAYQMVDFHTKFSSVTVRDRKSFYENYNRRLAEALGISSFFAKLQPALTAEFSNSKRWQLFSEVPDVLGRLQQRGCALGVVANWDANLPSLMEELGIREAFTVIVASAALGVEKPDPAIFHAAAAELGLTGSRQRVIYLGNEYGADVLGARAAGFVPVLIDRDDFWPQADCLRFASLNDWMNAM
jgi:putative hydrolase of the HAD superfamily